MLLLLGCGPEPRPGPADPAPSADSARADSGSDSAADSTPADSAPRDSGADDTGCDPRRWFLDADADGWGWGLSSVLACDAPDGYAAEAGDCDDGDPARHPDAVELCDGWDDDCDGELPDDEHDYDDDGWRTCDGECDDWDADVHPLAVEACDGLDDDCDGNVPADEADADGDRVRVCDGDCDDADTRIRGVEYGGDGLDNDCDGEIDTDATHPEFDWSACTSVVPTDHPTIQDAITAAADGDLVCVQGGAWYESIDFGGTDLHLLAPDGPEVTTIDGDDVETVVRFEAAESSAAILEGFTIAHGRAYGDGAGVTIVDASPTLTDLVIRDNEGNGYGGYGGGLYVDGGAPTLSQVTLRDNRIKTWFCLGYYGYGAGAFLREDDSVFDDVRIEDNEAGETGGGLYLYDSTAVLTHVTLRGNVSGYGGGGGLLASGGSVALENAIVTDNSCAYWDSPCTGAGLALYGGSPTVTNALVARNTADGDAGGIATIGASATFTNVIVSENVGAVAGLVVTSGVPTFLTNDVWGNTPADVDAWEDPTGTDGNVSTDPVLDGDHLAVGSPLVDVGTGLDPDGSPADIGAFGGASAAEWDLDGDGWYAWWAPGTSADGMDCDDEDPAVYPGSGC